MNKTLITFALFTYNQERFIRDAVKGALSQTYSPLEIIISDDCSQDHTFEIIKEEVADYSGPHTIILNRNKKNVGLGSHINQIMRMVKGLLIVIAAGDDISLPQRCERIYQVWKSSDGKIKSLYSDMMIIDGNGEYKGNYGKIEYNENHAPNGMVLWVYGCSAAYMREVFDIFGPMLTPLIYEDGVISFRSSLLGDIAYIDEPLVAYRRHSNNAHVQFEDTSNINNLLSARKRLLRDFICVRQNRFADLDKICRLYPSKRYDLFNMKELITRELESAQEELILYDASYYQRMLIITKALFKTDTSLKRVFRYCGMFLLPALYIKYLQLKNLLYLI
jgi:glycosyltransferase involved in cell wall biosynthesis